MEDKVVEYFLTQGPWAVVAVVMLFSLLRSNKEMRQTLDKFGDIIKVELNELKHKVKG